MEQSQAQRRLVKSPPELWAEVSSEDGLARRLARFGEIRITRVEPETTVAWEGDRASGTVRLEPAGWGTKVTLTAIQEPEPGPAAASPPPAREREAAVAPAASQPPVTPEPRNGLLARLLRRRRARATATAPDPGPPAPGPEPPPPDPGPAPTPAQRAAASCGDARPDDALTAAILDEMLDDLGAAHHRPFSRD